MAAGEQDEDSSRGDRGAQVPLVLAEGLLPMAPQLTRHILCRVVAGLWVCKGRKMSPSCSRDVMGNHNEQQQHFR